MTAPVEFTAKYATTVADLSDAWAFVMEHLDRVGPDPRIEISPLWIMSVHEALDETSRDVPREFEVTVSGMVRHDAASGDGDG